MTTLTSNAIAKDARFTVGDVVEARDVVSMNWRRAILIKHAPYPRGRTDGYYVTWEAALAPDFPQWQSSGGWMPTRYIRPISDGDSHAA